ncbi:major capsid protein [Nitratireductor rhodophyticola]|uniref:major capsid protein n=1 Tax=Nitratireductor rhodophyticola TaxID=2854036 RepID=UPI002AC99D34|nr:major capsid protein [Nitratireductor rhodophyticola]WPZ13248.1 major capsid protein [Nitratireductor rhodophyticola]
MSLSQMQVFNQYFMPAIIETLDQMVEKFNAASNGSIRLTTQGFDGDFLQESFFASIHSAQRRVDRYAAQAAAAATDLTQQKHSSVKIAGGFGPIRYEPSQMTWLQKPTAEGIEVASRNFAEAMMADQLNTAIAALVAAIENQADATNDVSGTAGISYGAMNDAHAKFGDHSGNLIAQVMNGAAYHKLIGNNLTNTQQLFQAQNVRVVDILGKAVVVTDAPALYEAGTPNKLKVLSLAESAALVHDGGDVITNIETANGQTRIETTLQMDYSFGLGLKGYTWDEANGGKSPSDAEIGTGTNWDRVATSVKHTAGTITVADAAQ